MSSPVIQNSGSQSVLQGPPGVPQTPQQGPQCQKSFHNNTNICLFCSWAPALAVWKWWWVKVLGSEQIKPEEQTVPLLSERKGKRVLWLCLWLKACHVGLSWCPGVRNPPANAGDTGSSVSVMIPHATRPYGSPPALFSHSVMSDSLQPHGLQHVRLPCPSPFSRACSNSCPLSRWCHPTISSSVTPFSSCPPCAPTSRSFPMSPVFASGGQSIVGASASTSALLMNIQGWFPLGWTGPRVPQQEKPSQWEALTQQWRVAAAHCNWKKPACSNKDPAQPKIN